jgi:hypothetical protein
MYGVGSDSFNFKDYPGLGIRKSFLLFLGEYLIGFSRVSFLLVLLVFIALNLAFTY